MDGEAAALRRGANRFEEIFSGTRARFHVDDHVGGNDFADAALDAVTGGVRFLEAGGARDADIDVDEIALAGAAQANAIHPQDAFDTLCGGENPALQSRGRNVEQSFERAPAHARTYPNDDSGDSEGGERVRETQPGNAEALAKPHGDDSEQHDAGAPNVRGEMQRVGFQCFAGILPRDAGDAAGARPVDADHQRQQAHGEVAGVQYRLAEQEAPHRLPNNVERREKEQRRFDERGETLEFRVAVGVVRVGGLVGNAHGKIGDNCGDEVETGVQGFGKNAQTSRADAEEDFERHQHERSADGSQRRQLFLPHRLCGCVHERVRTII